MVGLAIGLAGAALIMFAYNYMQKRKEQEQSIGGRIQKAWDDIQKAGQD